MLLVQLGSGGAQLLVLAGHLSLLLLLLLSLLPEADPASLELAQVQAQGVMLELGVAAVVELGKAHPPPRLCPLPVPFPPFPPQQYRYRMLCMLQV